MTISNEALEAAAKAAESCHDAWGTWEDVARAAIEAAAPLIQAEALEEAADAMDLPGSAATGYYASEQDGGYRDAERDAERWIRARAAKLRQP